MIAEPLIQRVSADVQTLTADQVPPKRTKDHRWTISRTFRGGPVRLFRLFVGPAGFHTWMGGTQGGVVTPGAQYHYAGDIILITDVFEFLDAGYVRVERRSGSGNDISITHISFRRPQKLTTVKFSENLPIDPEGRRRGRTVWTETADRLVILAADL